MGSLPDRYFPSLADSSSSLTTLTETDVVPATVSVPSVNTSGKKLLSVAIDAALEIDQLMPPQVTAVHFCATGKSDAIDFVCDRNHARLCSDIVASVYVGALYMAPHVTFDAQLGARSRVGVERYGIKGVSASLAARIRLETLYALNLSLVMESHILSQTPFVMVIPLLVSTTGLSLLDLDEFASYQGVSSTLR